MFNKSECTRCGICFHKCPEMKLPLDTAKEEIYALINGQNGDYVLWQCASCFSCNAYCPNDCHPYQLILSSWNRLYNERGAPPTDKLVCPTVDGNLWQMLHVITPDEEKQQLRKWQEPIEDRDLRNKPILLVGNLAHIMPFILDESPILDNFNLYDALDQWECGGYLYQLGYLDVVKQVGMQCKKDFKKWSEDVVIIPVLDAVHHMLMEVYPEELGIEINQKITDFHDFLLNMLLNGQIKLGEGSDMPITTVTIHDNCFSKASSKYWDTARKIITECGFEIKEMEHIRNDSRCCGFGAGCSWETNSQIVFDIMQTSKEKLMEAKRTSADALVTYCGGCYFILWAANELFDTGLKIYHTFELVRMASGETLNSEQTLQKERAWDLIAIFTYNLIKGLFSSN